VAILAAGGGPAQGFARAPVGYGQPVAKGINFKTAKAADIVAAIGSMDEEEFDALMSGDERQPVLDALISFFSSYFKPEHAEGVDAVLHVKLWDKPGGGYDHYEVVIRGGKCIVSAKPSDDDPDLTLKVRPTDLLGIVLDRTGPRRLAMRGRLRVLGDLSLGMRLGEMFQFPKA
jgi:putative sterol carrier protein